MIWRVESHISGCLLQVAGVVVGVDPVVAHSVPASLWWEGLVSGVCKFTLVTMLTSVLKPMFALDLLHGHCVVPETMVVDILRCVQESVPGWVHVDVGCVSWCGHLVPWTICLTFQEGMCW